MVQDRGMFGSGPDKQFALTLVPSQQERSAFASERVRSERATANSFDCSPLRRRSQRTIRPKSLKSRQMTRCSTNLLRSNNKLPQ